MTTVATDPPQRLPDAARLGLWGLVALVVALVRNGVWGTPNLPFFSTIADRWGSNPFPKGLDGDYLLTNLLGPTLARALGQTSPHEYARLHLVGLVVGLTAVIAAAYRRLGYRPAVMLLWVVAASPALTVAMEWLGQPDVWTFTLALALPLCRRHVTGFVLALLLGLSHPEQGLVAAAVAVAAMATTDNRVRSIAAWAAGFLGGVVSGRLITQAYLWSNDIEVSRPRTAYLCLGLGGFLDHHLKSPYALLYSLWGPLWAVVAYLTWRWWNVREFGSDTSALSSWPWVMVVAAAGLVPVMVTLDETRVYAMTTAPFLVVLASTLAELSPIRSIGESSGPSPQTAPRDARRTLAGVMAVVSLAAMPGMFNAGDDYWAPALRPVEFARFLADGTVPGGPAHTGQWLLSPFGFKVPPAC